MYPPLSLSVNGSASIPRKAPTKSARTKPNPMARTGLWRNSDFVKLWIGQTISEAGSRITREGLPLTAVLVLHASPTQMGFLAALGGVSVLVAGPVAGWVADHYRHRPVLAGADVARGLLLAAIPVAAATGSL